MTIPRAPPCWLRRQRPIDSRQRGRRRPRRRVARVRRGGLRRDPPGTARWCAAVDSGQSRPATSRFSSLAVAGGRSPCVADAADR
ncbi:unnamed protein product [Angiostrongylus costaricensis]|uniref:Uncharacterized protein n=1 Tax=Angiostrongylus costaricensis TaxID=334426 RepID=A0A0R3PQU8_ANGCS|nr:unnamed protein product [Angiostrongylus costaricensis]